MPHLSPTTLTADEQRLILRATVGHLRDHVIISLALGTGLRLGRSSASTWGTCTGWAGCRRCGFGCAVRSRSARCLPRGEIDANNFSP
jgi:hypothetical protein